MSLLAKLGLNPPPPSADAPPARSAPAAAPPSAKVAGSPDGKPALTRADGDLGQLLSLTLKPGDMTVDGEEEVHFTATGIDADGDPVDLTFDVEWSTSDATAVSVDANGVAQARPVSGKATVTATHAPSGLTASAVLTVTHKERLGPKLPPAPKPPPSITKIVITPDKPRVVLNRSEPLTASSVYDVGGGQDESQAVEWESTDPEIVSVDANGRVTGLSLGKATVSATEPNTMLTDWVTVEVIAAEITELSINPLDPSLHAAQLLQFHAVAEYSDGVSESVDDRVTWESSTPGAVTIDASGMAMGRNPGQARITARLAATDAQGATTTLEASTYASVPTLKSLAIEPAKASMLVGEEHRFIAMGVYSDRSRKEVVSVQWSSSDPGILSFDKGGGATGRGEGSAMVTATLAGKPPLLATAKVAVRPAPLAEVTIEMMGAEAFDGRLQRGQRLQLRAMGHSPVGSGKVTSRHLADAVWKSRDPKVATVSDGIVRALKVGDTVISAGDTASGITAETPLHVVEEAPTGSGFPENFDKLPDAIKAPYRDAKVRYDELLAELRTLDNVPRLMASLKDIAADIDKASPDAVDQAEKLETQTQLRGNVNSQIDAFADRVESTTGEIERADVALAVHEGHVEVARLRKAAKEQGKIIKAVMGALKGAWKVYEHQDYVSGALEVVSGALDLLVTSDYDKEADALEKTLDAKTKKLLEDNLKAVKKELGFLITAADRVKEQARIADAFANNLRDKAEGAFDAAAAKRGGFKFADTKAALTSADRVVDVLVPAFRTPAGSAIALIEKALPRAPKGSEAGILIREMHELALRLYAESVTIVKQVGAQRTQLQTLRREALSKLAFVNPAKVKPARVKPGKGSK